MLRAGVKAKYTGESNWAYENGKVYEVLGYDEDFDAWAVEADDGEAYLVGEHTTLSSG